MLLTTVVSKLAEVSLNYTLISVLILCMLAVGCNVAYNIFLHPLCNFPGPFCGYITDFYQTYLFSTRKFHLKTMSLHEKYGRLSHHC